VPAVLGIAAGEIADRTLPLRELWDSATDQLTAHLTAIGDDQERAATVLVTALDSRFRKAERDP
jgi:hypothetical protein